MKEIYDLTFDIFGIVMNCCGMVVFIALAIALIVAIYKFVKDMILK